MFSLSFSRFTNVLLNFFILAFQLLSKHTTFNSASSLFSAFNSLIMDLLGKRSSSRLFSCYTPTSSESCSNSMDKSQKGDFRSVRLKHVLGRMRRYLFSLFVIDDWVISCACVAVPLAHVDVRPPRYQSRHNACLESRDRLQRICVSPASEDACRFPSVM